MNGANNLARWDGSQWHAVGASGAINDRVFAIALNSNTVYVGGAFTSAGGVSNANRIALWNGLQWRAVGGGIDNWRIAAIVVSGDDLYIGGDFINAGGNPSADYIARLTWFRVYLPLTVR